MLVFNGIASYNSPLYVQLIRQNGTSYSFKAEDLLICKITDSISNQTPYTIEPNILVGQAVFKVSFKPTIAGTYSIDIRINGSAIGGAYFIRRTYQPGKARSYVR